MSKGALKELCKAPLEKFTRMAQCVPNSDKKSILSYFMNHLKILDGT